MDDPSLLELYARDGSADAFARLVGRYVDLVYSAAARQVGRGGLAEDVTQAVFIALARRARSGAFKDRSIVLSAWLLTATRYAAIDVLKRESRRRKHERGAAAMRSEIIDVPPGSQSGEESSWEEVRPVLDAAMLGLSEKDRRAVALRYFEGRSFEEVGAALGATRAATKQRVFRAIERLRERLLGRGVSVSAAALGALIGANAVQAAPPALVGACAAGACGAAASTAVLAGGTSAAAAAAAAPKIADGALAAMTWAKAKLAASAIAATLLVTGSVATIATVNPRGRAQTQSVPPIAQAPVVPVVAQAVQQDARPADDWYPVFLEAYAPKDGAVVRLVSPPFIDRRWNWWKSQQPRIRPLKPGERMFEKMFLIEFDGQDFRWKMVSVVDGNVDTALRHLAGLRPWEVVGPEKLTKAPLPGDWVYLAKSKQPERIANIAAIASATLKTKIGIRQVTKKLDVVVARGQLQLNTALDAQGRHVVEVGVGERIKPAPGASDAFGPPHSASIRQVFDEAENVTQVRFIDESDWGLSRVMMQRYVGPQKSKKEELARLITRLMEQTGLELQVEQRELEVWEVAEEKPG